MNRALPFALFGLVALAACGDRADTTTTPAPANGQLNPDATVVQPGTGTPPARADAEDPDTGTNNRRPDSPRDLQPGTDGNSPPVR